MCAITGLLTDALAPDVATAVARAMNDAQRHRGPDGEGYWTGDGAFLAHRRLAIIDLSPAAQQPLTNEDGSVVLVCNGEIYNYLELRRDLLRRGHRFKTQTDVEVILHLYEEAGVRCIAQLTGMFAFALWDIRRQRLVMARDRIGEKPLYYTETAGMFAFASEVNAVLKVPGLDRALDPEALAAYLLYPASPAPLTFFRGVRALPPASVLVRERGRSQVSRYWQLDYSKRRQHLRLADAIGELDVLLEQSVRGTLLADVAVGVLLSGGVDSSAIAVHAARAGAAVQTFSVGCDTPGRPDPEFARARLVASRLQLSHEAIPFRAVDLADLPRIVHRYGQPFNAFPMIYADQLAHAVRQRVVVALGGNGADEAFGGYQGYNRQLLANRLGPLARYLPDPLLAAFGPVTRDRVSRLRAAAHAPLAARRGELLNALARQLSRALGTPTLIGATDAARPGHHVADYARECEPHDYLDTVMYSDLMVYHQHSTTVVSDVSGMAYALEIRSPFLDHRLLEFACALPQTFKVRSAFRSRLNKFVLKRALESSLPHEILYGQKYGFGYNIHYQELLAGPWRGAVDRFVRRGRYLELDVFSRAGAEWAIRRAPAEVWRLLVFSIWADIYLFGASVGSVAAELRDAIGTSRTEHVA